MHSDSEIYNQLTRNLQQLNAHHDAEKKRLEKYIQTLPYPDKVTVYDIQASSGLNHLLEIEIARSTTLAAMATIKAAQKNGRK